MKGKLSRKKKQTELKMVKKRETRFPPSPLEDQESSKSVSFLFLVLL